MNPEQLKYTNPYLNTLQQKNAKSKIEKIFRDKNRVKQLSRNNGGFGAQHPRTAI